MARSGGYVILALNPSKSSDAVYELRRGGDGVLYCLCRGWQQSREVPKKCTHTKTYVAKHPGITYGPPGMFPEERGAPAPAARPSKRPVVVPQAPAATRAAPSDWRKMLLDETRAARASGIATPAAALAEFARDLDLDADEMAAVRVPRAKGGNDLDLD